MFTKPLAASADEAHVELSMAAGGCGGLLRLYAHPGCQRISGLSAAERLTLVWIVVDEKPCSALTGTTGGLEKAAGGDAGWLRSLWVWGGLNQTGQ